MSEEKLDAARKAEQAVLERRQRRKAQYDADVARLEKRIEETRRGHIWAPGTGQTRRAFRQGGAKAVAEREKKIAEERLKQLHREYNRERRREEIYRRIKELFPWLFAKPEGE